LRALIRALIRGESPLRPLEGAWTPKMGPLGGRGPGGPKLAPGGGAQIGGPGGGAGGPPRGRRSGISEISCGATLIKTRFFRAPKNTFIKRAARPRVPDFGHFGPPPEVVFSGARGPGGGVWDPYFGGGGGVWTDPPGYDLHYRLINILFVCNYNVSYSYVMIVRS